MARKRQRSAMPESTVFPFISVLLCTMGAMVLVWMSFSLASTLSDPKHGVEAATAEAELASLAQLVAEGQGRLNSLADLRSGLDENLATAKGRLAARQQALEEAQQRERELAVQRAELLAALAPVRDSEAKLASLRARVTMAESALSAEAQRDDLAAQLAQVERDLAAQAARQAELDRLGERNRQVEAEIAAVGPGGRTMLKRRADNTLRPQLVEVSAAGVRLLPGELALPPTPVAQAIADGGALRRAAATTADGATCVVLLVRPDGAAEARRLGGALRDLRAVFTSEPVDADWNLAGLAEQAAGAAP